VPRGIDVVASQGVDGFPSSRSSLVELVEKISLV
jgi:hypothetical protein